MTYQDQNQEQGQDQERAQASNRAGVGEAVEGAMDAGQMVPSVPIEQVIAHRNAALSLATEGLRLLLEADRLLVDAGFGSSWSELGQQMERTRHTRYRSGYEANDPEWNQRADPSGELVDEFTKVVDASAWQYLLDASGLRTFMDTKAREEWNSAIGNRKTPPLNLDNIEATFQQLYHSRGDMVERGVIEVFRTLSWCYKSNLPEKFGKRVVITYLNSFHGRSQDKVDDLVRALCLLDGKPEPDHRESVGTKIRSRYFRQDKLEPVEHEYFTIKLFKNSNGHLIFKRMDLVDKLNAIVAKHYPGALPPPSRNTRG